MSYFSFNAESSLYSSRLNYRSSRMQAGPLDVTLSQGVPNGTYLQSCDGCYIAYFAGSGDPVLACRCWDFNGQSNYSIWPNPQNCPADIANCNGQLWCGTCGQIAQ